MQQLTNFSQTHFAQKTADHINKDYPQVAKVVSKDDGEFKVTACFITDTYLDFCKDYVLKNCRTKK